METVKNKPSIVLVGKGRIGLALSEELTANGLNFQHARIDCLKGLFFPDDDFISSIQVLVICISARQKSKQGPSWSWHQIFEGLSAQIAAGKLVVQNLIFVSSTRVYEAIDKQIVNAKTSPKTHSEGGEGLAVAENILLRAVNNTYIMRCSGLYGDLYPVYTPILLSGKEKARFGIDAAEVVSKLAQLVKSAIYQDLQKTIALLTDTFVYYEGACLNWEKDFSQIKKLSRTFRILQDSVYLPK
ncbi:hypothetical protein [Aliikangiella maris]|uniref:Uncharacterized protein n=2 Tax=Aliikangiella maris TaxID=3162458 RepID=A0ABV3MSH9_9GAMM